MPATRVSSHAYVNPLVAVALGYFLLGEEITLQTIMGTVLVVASVFLILTKAAPAQPEKNHATQPTALEADSA